MRQETKTLNIQDVATAMAKKWYWVTIPLITFLMLGAWYYVVVPRNYQASTLILIQPQEIPSSYVQSTVSTGIEERVRTLSQEVTSRSNLEKIITELDLYKKERAEGRSMDIIVAGMRKKIDVRTSGGGRRGQVGSFSISYRAADPRQCADVANKLAAFFIDTNLVLRARQAAQTTIFLEKQLNELKELLDGQEKKVEAYRNRYMGELPEQLQSNISTIAGLQVRFESIQATLSDAMNRRLLIQRQLSQIENDQPGATLSRRGQRSSELKSRLEELKSQYTSVHPEVRRIEEQIRELEASSGDGDNLSADPQVLELRVQFDAITAEIASLKKDQARVKERIEFYQQRVENTPKREQELAALTRDYDITQQNYQRLLDRLFEAKRAESMEKRQQGEQFRILDFAQPPETPVSPDRNKVALIFLFIGLAAGAGVIVLFEIMDSSVKSVDQLEELSGGIPCISSVPLALTEADKNRKRYGTGIMIAANVMILVVGAGIVLYFKINDIVVNIPLPL